MKVVFGSVIYKQCIPYLKDFTESLITQSFRDFDVVIINDGVDKDIVNRTLASDKLKVLFFSFPPGTTPADLRVKLLEIAKEKGADYFVSGDADDWFSHNRIENSVDVLDSSGDDFVYNEIVDADANSVFPQLPRYTYRINDILEYNYLGLTNTSIKMKGLTDKFIRSLYGCNTHVFDWYLFSRILLNGGRGSYVDRAVSYYRIHRDNFIGIPKMTVKMIEKEIYIKKEHYTSLATYDSIYKEYAEAYSHDRYSMNNSDSYYWWNLTKGRIGNEI